MPREKAKRRKKKGKFQKNSDTVLVLSEEDLQFLIQKTSFDAVEISEWFRYDF